MEDLLSQKHAAQKLKLSMRTLERHRVAGTGPRYAKLGRVVRYDPIALEEWVSSNTRASTSR